MSARARGDRASSGPGERVGALTCAELIPFPLASRRPLVAEMADRFLTIPAGRQRLARFERELGSLTKTLRKLGVSEERLVRELEPFRVAIANEVRRLLANDVAEGNQE